jgi:rhodanese-related sulfurtransferase
MFDLIKRLFKPKTDMVKLVREGAAIVDVRTKAEYQSGHIDGSRNIPLDKIKTEVAALKRLNKPVITVCRSGARSAAAKAVLSSAGIEVYNGGAWNSLKKRLQ